jgi:signal peptidase I
MLRIGERYRLTLAFIDRRVSLAINDQIWQQIDLTEAKQRGGVTQPFQVQAEGARAVLHSFRLYRDVHYGQQGIQAVRGKSVRLGVDQYFVLGDNSPHSEDSRHWPDEGRVPSVNLLGPLLWAH